MAQKLLLFWRKPARRCWWECTELEDVEGVEGKLKVWIRRVWTLEMVRIPDAWIQVDLELTFACFRVLLDCGSRVLCFLSFCLPIFRFHHYTMISTCVFRLPLVSIYLPSIIICGVDDILSFRH